MRPFQAATAAEPVAAAAAVDVPPPDAVNGAKVFAAVDYGRRREYCLFGTLLFGMLYMGVFARSDGKRSVRVKKDSKSEQRIHRALWEDAVSEVATGTRMRAGYETYCEKNSELFPGKVYDSVGAGVGADLVWEPDRDCKLKHFSGAEAVACVSAKQRQPDGFRIAVFGDSLADDLVGSVGERLGLTSRSLDFEMVNASRRNRELFFPSEGRQEGGAGSSSNASAQQQQQPVFQFFWTHSAFSDSPTDSVKRPNASKALAAADVVILHQGMWDMGPTCKDGVFTFYQSLVKRVEEMRAVMKTTARLVIFDLHWIHNSRCLAVHGPHSKCFRCNPPPKVHGYRQALNLVAACTNSELLSNKGIYKTMPAHTLDGIHYNETLSPMEADVFLNGLCTRGDKPPMQLDVPLKCDERTIFTQWVANTDAGFCKCMHLT